MAARHVNRWQDTQWWLALIAGPVFYFGLFAKGTAYADIAWISSQLSLFLVLGLVYPVLEEIVFRGMLQEGLERRLKPGQGFPFSKANIITSGVFAALHGFSHAPVWAAAVFLPSLLFGHFKERHGGLASPILLHAFYNSGYYALFGAPG